MKYIGGSWDALAATLQNFLRPVITQSRWNKPARLPEERAERYRASFALTHEANGDQACIACKICENICPSQVITVVPGPKKESPATGKKRAWCDDFTLDLQGCIFCELCVQVCPVDAIVMRKVQEVPGYSRADLVLTMDSLYANETEKPATWATASKLKDMQDPARAAAPVEPKPAVEAKAPVEPAPAEPKGAH